MSITKVLQKISKTSSCSGELKDLKDRTSLLLSEIKQGNYLIDSIEEQISIIKFERETILNILGKGNLKDKNDDITLLLLEIDDLLYSDAVKFREEIIQIFNEYDFQNMSEEAIQSENNDFYNKNGLDKLISLLNDISDKLDLEYVEGKLHMNYVSKYAYRLSFMQIHSFQSQIKYLVDDNPIEAINSIYEFINNGFSINNKEPFWMCEKLILRVMIDSTLNYLNDKNSMNLSEEV
ncbi:hypothetical protein [Clostridium perfringens]|uniref:hypothetical protein n=1 Tax=Clostridium perfringens TaxID=1502 RepID=UPI001897799E|nr:hypothetical protein [Clostridium perfringens]